MLYRSVQLAMLICLVVVDGKCTFTKINETEFADMGLTHQSHLQSVLEWDCEPPFEWNDGSTTFTKQETMHSKEDGGDHYEVIKNGKGRQRGDATGQFIIVPWIPETPPPPVPGITTGEVI